MERSRLTGLPPDRVSGSIAAFDFLYMSELARRKVVAPTVAGGGEEEEEPTTGGHVLEPEPGLLIETFQQYLELAERIDSPWLGLNFDIGHAFCVGQDPELWVGRMAEHTRHYHIEDIAANKDAGKVARYCEYVLNQVDRYELALTVHSQLALQNKQLEATQSRIDKARTTRLGQVKNTGRFAVVGILQNYESGILKCYKIVNDSDRTICYARASTGAENADYSKLVGRKVGLVGEITPYLAMSSALIKFTHIEQIR